jgi:GntR family transcriptional regulator
MIPMIGMTSYSGTVGIVGCNEGITVTEPMYRRIARDLRDKIESGEVAPGKQLPTELELKDRYGASRNTIRDAVGWLTRHGLVERRPGQGTFVARSFEPFVTTLSADQETGPSTRAEAAFAEEMQARGHILSSSAPKVEILYADRSIAARLGIPEGTQVVRRVRELSVDREPCSQEATVVSMELVTRGAHDLLLASDLGAGVGAYLHRQLGIDEIGRQDRILVRPATDEESRLFHLGDDGDPLVWLVRTSYQAGPDGPVPFLVTFTVLPADRSQLIINAGQVPRTLVGVGSGSRSRVGSGKAGFDQ